MPTVAEPQGPIKDAKRTLIIADFLANLDPVEVFRARLFGTGLRGHELGQTMRHALQIKYEQEGRPKHPCKVLVMERDGRQSTIRFSTDFHAGRAVEMLRRQPNVLFASRVYS